jgi:hypothetical protein
MGMIDLELEANEFDIVHELLDMLKAERAENVRLVNLLLIQQFPKMNSTLPAVNIPESFKPLNTSGKDRWSGVKERLEKKYYAKVPDDVAEEIEGVAAATKEVRKDAS